MTFEQKRDKALALLAATGILRSNYEPPAFRLLWRAGVQLPPPHFLAFGMATLIMGTWFAVLWGVLMWIFVWSGSALPVVVALIGSLCAGVLFGLSLAGYYAYGRRKHHLPTWSEL